MLRVRAITALLACVVAACLVPSSAQAAPLPAPTLQSVVVQTQGVPYALGRVVATWTPVPGATGYAVSAWSEEGYFSGAWLHPASATSGGLGHLLGGVEFRFVVQAMDGTSAGVPSNSILATPVTVPENPSPQSVDTTTSPGSTIVKWRAADAGGSPVTSYTITQRLGGTQTVDGSTTTATFPGTDTLGSDFTVTATNALGTSAEPPVPMNPVQNLVVSEHEGKVTTSWLWPVAGHGLPHLYQSVLYDQSKQLLVAATAMEGELVQTLTLANVPRGAYTVRVSVESTIGGLGVEADTVDAFEPGALPARVRARSGTRVVLHVLVPADAVEGKVWLMLKAPVAGNNITYPKLKVTREASGLRLSFLAPRKPGRYWVRITGTGGPGEYPPIAQTTLVVTSAPLNHR